MWIWIITNTDWAEGYQLHLKGLFDIIIIEKLNAINYVARLWQDSSGNTVQRAAYFDSFVQKGGSQGKQKAPRAKVQFPLTLVKHWVVPKGQRGSAFAVGFKHRVNFSFL